MPQNLDMCSEGKAMISIKLCSLVYHQQVHEMVLNDWYSKNTLWKERNSELYIANKLTLMFHQLTKSVQ